MLLRSKKALPLLALGLAGLMPMSASAQAAWKITKEAWTVTDERNYSAFVTAMGESNCTNTDTCFKIPGNPFRATDDASKRFWSDCAKFPYLLRAYFAAKSGLPFGYVTQVAAAEGGTDLRYSPRGNVVVSRRGITQASVGALPLFPTLNTMLSTVNSAMFRSNPELDVENGLFSDFYSARVDRNEVRPGTIIYDPNGHVAVVYKVEADGRVRFIDAHPDNSITRGVYGEKFARSNPGMGAGFKNFRPVRLVNATRTATGDLVGGRIVGASHAEIPGFSTEQFFGTNPAQNGRWQSGTFVVNGVQLGYYDFVRTRLAIGDLKYKPVEEMVNGIDALCTDIKDRVAAVDGGLAMSSRPQPDRLPHNIYGTHGDWESYSTPSRDARLKTSFAELRKNTAEHIRLYREGNPRIEYSGTNLVADLRDAYDRAATSCVIEYTRSDRSKVRLDFNDVSERLFALSFDPYHCPELRWGASTTAELSTCRDDSTKRAWYDAEQGLRNQLERTYDAPMGNDLATLQNAMNNMRAGRPATPGTGVATPPDVNLRAFLHGL